MLKNGCKSKKLISDFRFRIPDCFPQMAQIYADCGRKVFRPGIHFSEVYPDCFPQMARIYADFGREVLRPGIHFSEVYPDLS